MIGQWISSVPVVAFSIIAGALSDVFGRKPLILFPIVGDFISGIFTIINYAFIETLPIEFFYTEKIGSFFGGYAVYYLGIYSYGTVITSPKERSHRLARLDGMETTALVIGTILAPIVFKNLGYFGSYGFSCFFNLLAIIYILKFVKEPMMEEREEQEMLTEENTKQQGQVNFFESIVWNFLIFYKIFIKIPLRGMKEVLLKDRKIILKFLIFIQFICFITYWLTWQIFNITYLYMHLVFEGFTETDYSHYYVAMSALNTFCLVVIMPILSRKFQIHDAVIIFIILMCEVISFCITTFATTLWQFYLAQGLGTMGYCKFAIVRSLISQCIDKNEVGKFYSFLAVLAALAPVAGNPLFRQLYNATLDTFPGAIFLLYGAILFCPAMGNLFLYFMRSEMTNNAESNLNVKEQEGNEFHEIHKNGETETTYC